MHAPHPYTGTMLPGGMGPLFTCDACGAEFAGTHKASETARYCRDCKPVGFDEPDTRVTPDDLRRESKRAVERQRLKPDPAPGKTYGRSVFDPRWADGEPRPNDEYDAHAQDAVRALQRRRMTRL